MYNWRAGLLLEGVDEVHLRKCRRTQTWSPHSDSLRFLYYRPNNFYGYARLWISERNSSAAPALPCLAKSELARQTNIVRLSVGFTLGRVRRQGGADLKGIARGCSPLMAWSG